MHFSRNVIVGFDGTPESRDALVLGKALAAVDDAQLHVAFAQWDDNPATERERFDKVLSEVRRELGTQPYVSHPLRATSAGRALYELAEDLEAELIAVGSTHRGAVGRILVGSVGEMLLQGAPCAVAVAPRGYAGREHFGIGLIGIAYDGTPEAHLALMAGAKLASRLDCSVRLIAAVPHVQAGSRITGTVSGYRQVLEEDLMGRLEAARSELPAGVQSEVVVEHGDPAKVIAAHGVELDLLVIGSRGYGPVRSVLLGGVSGDVMKLSPCPVLVTPRGADAEHVVGAGSPGTFEGRTK
jgi:nucleotide-binding universal stress UspA family protein